MRKVVFEQSFAIGKEKARYGIILKIVGKSQIFGLWLHNTLKIWFIESLDFI